MLQISAYVFALIVLNVEVSLVVSSNDLDVLETYHYRESVNTLANEWNEVHLHKRANTAVERNILLGENIRETRLAIPDEPKNLFPPACFNNGNELCCGKNVYHGQFPYRAQCCGNDIYDTSTARCCDGIIHLTEDYNLQCCGKLIYDQRKKTCCNGKVQDIKKNGQCCDALVYDPLRRICCNGTLSDINGKILSCCLKVDYESVTSHCINDVVQKKTNAKEITQVCGTHVIDYKTKICCDNEPLDRTNDFTLCCGKTTVSASTQLCCNGTVISDPKDGDQCCEKKVYNPATQVCCKGNVITRPENSVGTFDYCRPQFVPGLIQSRLFSPYFECCGEELVTNNTIQLCCNDKLYTFDETPSTRYNFNCCGSEKYRPSEKTCCVDNLVSGSNRLCCGKQTYDLNKKICCADQLYNHDGVPKHKCC